MKDVTLNQREQASLQVLNSVVEYQLPRAQATELLGISERRGRRILADYRRVGTAALVHGNRGRKPRNSVPEDVAATTVILASEKYVGFNHSHLIEALAEREGIQLSRQTISRLLNRHGLTSARRHRPPKHRVRRESMPQEGMLLQIDGSHHRWLGDRGPRFVLLLAVDDATGTVANAIFRPEEDTRGYFQLLDEVIRRYRHPPGSSTVIATGSSSSTASPRHVPRPVGPTQFTRAMGELGIEPIFALSPQAKGRVERMNGTFQDRLVRELRLAGAATIDQANAVLRDFLPRFNSQFRVPAQQSPAVYRSLDSSLHPERVLCFKHLRQVARDNTVKYQLRTLQLPPAQNRPQLCRCQGGDAGAERRTVNGAARGEGDRPSGSSAQGGSVARRPGGMAPTPELAQVVRNLRPAWSHQVATAAPGRFGSTCRPTHGRSTCE